MADPPLAPTKPFGKQQTATVYVAPDPLRSVYVYVDVPKDQAEKALTGKKTSGGVVFVTVSGKKKITQLTKTWFPAGTWQAVIDAKGSLDQLECKFPKDMDPKVVASLRERGTHENVIDWVADQDVIEEINKLVLGSRGRSVRIVVSYSKLQSGDIKSVPDQLPLTGGNNALLADPLIAEMYLQFVEHFGGVKVDHNLATGGLTEEEIKLVEADRPKIIEITNLFVQGLGEFDSAKGSANPPVDINNLRALLEVLFYQRKAKNDLARRNMLAIGIAQLWTHDSAGKSLLKPDIGIHRRVVSGPVGLLLYDRFGSPVRFMGRPMDTEHRSIDLDKINRDSAIPHFSIEVSDKGLYLFLRSLEQTFGEPLREVEALAASLYKHSIFISHEIDRRYNGQIGQRIIEMAPVVIAFFVVHAIATRLMATGHPAAFAFMALVKGAGLIFGLDFALISMAKLAEAGAHFHRLEELSREDGKEVKLTKLSEQHLYLGSMALIDAMADFIAMGVFIAVPLAVVKGRALAEGLKKSADARVELKVENGRAVEIKSKKSKAKIEVAVPKKPAEGTSKGLGTKDKAPDKVPESKPIEDANAGAGEGKRAGKPKPEILKPKRPRALDMTAEQLRADKAAQIELFQAAQEAVARQNAFIQRILKSIGIEGAEAKSILKRPTFEEFIEGVLAKVGERKGYKTVGEMTDMIRGRINLELPEQVRKVVRALQRNKEAVVINQEGPQTRMDVKGAYPRHHLDVVDPVTGIKHEWQVGTKQTTQLYEAPGIEVGKVKVKPENRNIHDIEYDIFKAINDPSKKLSAAEQAQLKKLAEDVGIPAFRLKVAKLSARLGKENLSAAELQAEIKALHKEAGEILKKLVDAKGGDPAGVNFVEGFLH